MEDATSTATRQRHKIGSEIMTNAQFTWIGFYEELADKLLAYRNRRDNLINGLPDNLCVYWWRVVLF